MLWDCFYRGTREVKAATKVNLATGERGGYVKRRVPAQYRFNATSLPALGDVPVTVDGKEIGRAKLSRTGKGIDFEADCDFPRNLESYRPEFESTTALPDGDKDNEHFVALTARVASLAFFTDQREHGSVPSTVTVDGVTYREFSGWESPVAPSLREVIEEMRLIRKILEAQRPFGKAEVR